VTFTLATAIVSRSSVKYKVTGGADGTAGVEVAGRRYEAGDEIAIAAGKYQWLIEQGYVEPVTKTSKTEEPTSEEQDA